MGSRFDVRRAAHYFRIAIRTAFAVTLLLVLLVQISPFTLREPPSVVDPEQGITLHLKTLQVCDDGSGFGGLLADHSWLPTLLVGTPSYQPEALDLSQASALLPPGHSQRLLRPPRA